MVAVVARPPFELNKINFLTDNLLFYVFKPIECSDMSEVLSKTQQIKFFEEVTGLFVSINWEKWSENVSRCNVLGELRPRLCWFLELPLPVTENVEVYFTRCW